MELLFITSNKGKFKEIQHLIPQLKQSDIDLPEIQEIDPQKIIAAKLQEAYKLHSGQFIVEDTSLYVEELNGLPGPLIKWFLKTIRNEGIAELASRLSSQNAIAKTCIGYARSVNNIHFFEGTIEGSIVFPRGDNGFGWDAIFKPNGQEKTFAEMTLEEKTAFSMRRIATEKLLYFLNMT